MPTSTLQEMLAVVNDLANQLRQLQEQAEVILKDPIAEFDTNTPQGRFLGALLGLGTDGVAPPTKVFEDGVVFQAYPISPYIPDYDAIGGLNQSDVPGEKWRPYNNGKPAWNAKEMGSATPAPKPRAMKPLGSFPR